MRVVLFRHGIAQDRADPRCPPDPDRALTDEGEKKTKKAARGLSFLGCRPTRVLTSPYLRAQQTAALAADALDVSPAQIITTDVLLPDAPPYALFQALHAFSEDDEVLCAGHAPNLDRVLALALTGDRVPVTAMKKSGAALLELADLPRTHGELVWLLPPKALAALG